jgi:hypothetical protein
MTAPNARWRSCVRALPLRVYSLASLSLVALQALLLFLMGRVPYCTCGYVKLWEGDVASAGNSQHITDWYSFTHVLHGFGLYLLSWLVGRRWPVGPRLLLAALAETSWEVLENTNFVIDRYRAETISLQYYGDSIVNSVSDTTVAILGFLLARYLPVWLTIALAVAMEAGVGLAIRDNLFLNILMLIYPIPWIEAWQLGG